jgi:hypothetical protein
MDKKAEKSNKPSLYMDISIESPQYLQRAKTEDRQV